MWVCAWVCGMWVCAACGCTCTRVHAFGGVLHVCACECRRACVCKYGCVCVSVLHVCACLCACVGMCVCVCVCVQRLGGAAAPGERWLLYPACFILESSATGSSRVCLSFLCRQVSQMGLNEEENETPCQH